jgi:CO/xanthine dehydrogenase Mo-binding subunit/uncharacterized protein with von Willebrand factor type A (vWA) domain
LNAPGDAIVRRIATFGGLLRHAGVEVGPGRVLGAVQALQAIELGQRDQLYWALRCTLVARREQLPVFDAAFAAFWGAEGSLGVPTRPSPRERGEDDAATAETVVQAARRTLGAEEAPDESAEAADRARSTAWSPDERLAELDFAHYGEEELREARAVIARIAGAVPLRRSRRQAPCSAGGTLDARRTMRAAMRTEGHPLERRWRAAKIVPRRLTFLLDVSGSMEPYARACVMFLHAAVRAAPNVEAMTFGTRLTRLTPHFGVRDPERALAQAARAVPDWSGGTRIGESLKAFNDGWGRRGLTRGAVIVIVSDGWERGDTGLLGGEMQRLARMAHKVVWVNPVDGRRHGRRAALDRRIPPRPQPAQPPGARRCTGRDRRRPSNFSRTSRSAMKKQPEEHEPLTIGARAPRIEDDRLLRGAGRFVDDIDVPGQLHMRVVRSGVAHARIAGIDTSEAAAAPGVQLVATAADLGSSDPIPLRLDFGVDLDAYLQQVLATDRVRYVGEPVAVVVAEDPYRAEDAADLVDVHYEPLPPVLDAREAMRDDAEQLRDGAGNEVICIEKSFGDVDEAFSSAAHVVQAELSVGRHTGTPMETRGLVADWDAGRGHLTIWGAALVTHYHQRVLSRLLDLPVSKIHMRGTDAGGNFGVRGDFFPEDFLVPWLAMRTGRPVKWVEDRAEHFVSINHAREQVHRIEAAFDEDGRLLGLRDEIWHDKGAYIRPTGLVVSEISVGMLPWPYRVHAYEGRIHVVMTNKTPVGPYRAPGRYEGTFAREHLLTIAARELDMDPVELRRINLIDRSEIPFAPDLTIGGEPFVLNSGDCVGLLEKALDAADFAAWVEEAEEMRAEGRIAGTSVAYFVDKSGLGVYETAGIDIGVDGSVRILIGGASSGQGIETVMAQIAMSELGVPLERVEVVHGDTDLIPDGVGSWSSRSTVIGGSAVLNAARATADKARRIAAELLEASVEDLVLADGSVHVLGSRERGVTLGEVAAACDTVSSQQRGETPGLGAREIYIDPQMNYPYGVAFAQVEIDPDTGHVDVRRYFCAYEIGKAVNPMLVEGQIVGGVAQGIGGALFEELSYGDDGQPRSASFMDYLVPGATEVPHVGTLVSEDAPTPSNPLGAKGAGESGIMAVGAAVAGAVGDAVGDPRAVHALPLTPERVMRLLADTRDAVS